MDTSSSHTLKKIGWAALIMMASVFLSRVIGLVRESAIAWLGGAGAGVDAYQIAFIIPEILNHIVASGFLSITFIPIFAGYLARSQEAEGFRVFSVIFNGFGSLLLVFISLSVIFAPELVQILAPGIHNPQTFDMAVRMTRIIIPAQFFFFSGGLFMAVQFTRERFFVPALAPLVYNIGIISGGLLLHRIMGMEGFAWGVLAGAFAGSFLIQLWGAKKTGLVYTFTLDFRHPDFIRYLLLTLPLMLGLTMTFSTEVLMKFFGSCLDPDSMSAMNYALRIMFILVGFFGQAVGMASYPFMAKLAAAKAWDQLNTIINQTMKYIFLVVPFSVLFMVLRHEIVAVLFQRGAFDSQDTALTAGILPFFMAGAFAFSAQTIVSRGFFACQNTLFPAVFSTVCVLASLPLIWCGMHFFGIRGVALGLTVSVALTSFFLFESWNRKSGNTEKGGVYLFFWKMVLVSVLLGALLQGVYRLILPVMPAGGTTWYVPGALGTCLVVGISFLGFLLLAGRIFKIPEISGLYQKLFRRVVPWRKN